MFMYVYTGAHTCVCGSPAPVSSPVSLKQSQGPISSPSKTRLILPLWSLTHSFSDFMCTVSYLHICMYTLCVPMDSEIPCGCWEPNSGPVQEQRVLYVFEPSLQHPVLYLVKCLPMSPWKQCHNNPKSIKYHEILGGLL